MSQGKNKTKWKYSEKKDNEKGKLCSIKRFTQTGRWAEPDR